MGNDFIEKNCVGCVYYRDMGSEGEISFCVHPENKDDHEGNCTLKLCPIPPEESKRGDNKKPFIF